MLTSVKYWLWLTSRLDPAPAWQVFCHFGSPEKAYFSDPGEYRQVEGLSPDQQRLLEDKSVSAAEQILARCDRQNIRILTFSDTDFPERLRNIEVPPLVLYLRGRLLRFDEQAVIAFAGTRKATPYGTKAAYDFARDITRGGGLVATGVVMGCDQSAAMGALQAGGPLVCIVAGGVDVPYYDSEAGQRLLSDVAAAGAVLSEAPPGAAHKGGLFRRRNAILCGLSLGLLCVEAGQRSGTLRVAGIASEQGKDVFAIPANLGAKASLGTNDLLRRGLATPVTSGADILSHYNYLLPQKRRQPDFTRWQVIRIPGGQRAETPPSPPPSAPSASKIFPEKKVDTDSNRGYIELLDASVRWTEEERAVLKALISGPATTEALIAGTGRSAALVSATLTMLVVAGAVEELPGGRFQLVPEGLN